MIALCSAIVLCTVLLTALLLTLLSRNSMESIAVCSSVVAFICVCCAKCREEVCVYLCVGYHHLFIIITVA